MFLFLQEAWNSEALSTIGKEETLKKEKKKKNASQSEKCSTLSRQSAWKGVKRLSPASQPEWRESGGPAEIEKCWQRSRAPGAQLLPSDLVSLGKRSKVQHKYVGSVFNMGKRSSACCLPSCWGGGFEFEILIERIGWPGDFQLLKTGWSVKFKVSLSLIRFFFFKDFHPWQKTIKQQQYKTESSVS